MGNISPEVAAIMSRTTQRINEATVAYGQLGRALASAVAAMQKVSA